MRFRRLLSFRLPSGTTGLPAFSMSPSPLIEEEVGEFCSEHDNGLTASFSSQVHVGSDFTDNMFACQHVARVESLWAMTSEKRF